MKKTAFILALIMLFSFTYAYADEWVCPNCGKSNTTNFCTSCGTKHEVWICPACGTENSDAFCGNCGTQKPVDLSALYGVWEATDEADETGYLVFHENGTLVVITSAGIIIQMKYTATADQITMIKDDDEQTYEYHIDNDTMSFSGFNTSFTRAEHSMEEKLKTIPDVLAKLMYFGTIKGFSWKRTISMENLTETEESGWQLPAGATLREKKEEIHHYDSVLDHYEEKEVEKSRQVLDHYETYYTYKDNGDGTFKEESHERPVYETEYYTDKEQQPVYRQEPVYKTKYYYTVLRLKPSRTETAGADNHNPEWPAITSSKTEREIDRTEEYFFTFSAGFTSETQKYKISQKAWDALREGDTVYLAFISGGYVYLINDAGYLVDTVEPTK